MTTALDVLENFSKLNIDKEVKVSIGKTVESLKLLNIEQLKAGQTSKGSKFQKYRSRDYAEMKNQMNSEPGLGNPDLILTGAFVSSIQVDVGGDSLEITANDVHGLFEKYGENNILGLQDKQQDYYNHEIFYPEFRAKIEEITGL